MFCEKGILRNFAKFTGKHLYQGLFLNKVASLTLGLALAFNFIKKENLGRLFSCPKLLRTHSFYGTPPVADSASKHEGNWEKISESIYSITRNTFTDWLRKFWPRYSRRCDFCYKFSSFSFCLNIVYWMLLLKYFHCLSDSPLKGNGDLTSGSWKKMELLLKRIQNQVKRLKWSFAKIVNG